MRIFAVAALALAGLALAFTPWTERLEAALLDLEWSVLRRFDPEPAPADIVIVGVDDRTAATIAAPRELWHESLGLALVRIASARPRAIGVEWPLPERSFDPVRPGLDRALMVGLAAARENGPLVASLSIDARTRAARPIHGPFLAVLGEERLGLDLLARDPDGVARRFTLGVPTEDGAFPTLAGRLCKALSRGCTEGLVNFALGEPIPYFPLQRVLETRDTAMLRKMFGDRVVLIGDVQRFSNRIPVPVNYAGWEQGGRESPAVVVHAQSLRTAMLGKAPREASRPVVAILVTLAAFLFLMRDWRHTLLVGLLAAVAAFALAVLSLRAGVHIPVAGAMLALLFAWGARVAAAAGGRFELRRLG
jgi:CHASE2 domain-containing sensor protein